MLCTGSKVTSYTQNKKFLDMSLLYKSQTKKVIERVSKELIDSLKK